MQQSIENEIEPATVLVVSFGTHPPSFVVCLVPMSDLSAAGTISVSAILQYAAGTEIRFPFLLTFNVNSHMEYIFAFPQEHFSNELLTPLEPVA